MGPLIHTLNDLVAVLREDPGLRSYVATRIDEGVIEVRFGGATLVLLAARMCVDPARIGPHLARARAGAHPLLLVGAEEDFAAVERIRDHAELSVVPLPMSRARLGVTLRNNFAAVLQKMQARKLGRYADRYHTELEEVVAIARALASERDSVRLLALILEKSRAITGADAGSVAIVEDGASGTDRLLRVVIAQNDSVPIDFRPHTIAVDAESIGGAVVIDRRCINIPDLYRVDAEGTAAADYRLDREADTRTGYQTRSVLSVPMANQRDEVIGVVQLVNRKRDPQARLRAPEDFTREVVPFDRRGQELAETVAAQAGISLENTMLYEDIRRLFEGFVTASVAAIEARDPTTSGHSQRVALLTCGLAETVNRTDTGVYAGLTFSSDDLKQIEYAGLLHDFGKVSVREKVLVKAKKLYEPDRDLLLARFNYVRKAIENKHLRRWLDRVTAVGPVVAGVELAGDDAELRAEIDYIDEVVAFILRANEPTVLAEGSFERLAEIAMRSYDDPYGVRRPYLTAAELEALKVARGSLTLGEREEIERHVQHTYQFLNTIPWGRAMRNIPRIAGAHHEKLDGSGYPRGLTEAEIPVEAKMMAIADIYDALTASDRPYKRAVPRERALDILADEVRQGKCDPELFRIFIAAQIWNRLAPR